MRHCIPRRRVVLRMNMKLDTGRILIAGAGSGSGKTTITAGILKCLENRGIRAASFKCGPDYIDPMFHSRITGRPAGTLDPYFCDAETLRFLLASESEGCGLAVLEGVMGYYDGIGFSSEASTFTVARATETPVILVIGCRGMGASAAAVLRGFLEHASGDSMIRGVIFNQFPAKLAHQAMAAAEKMGVRAVGYLPTDPRLTLESRHLGLVTAGEVTDFDQKIDRLAAAVENTIDIGAILELASAAEPVVFSKPAGMEEENRGGGLRIAVAKDRAFNFIYRENTELLQRAGCEIVYFSPLEEDGIPENVDGLILSGGYPELYADRLSWNLSMRASVAGAVSDGLPTLAECGGFLYLHAMLEGTDGIRYPVAGVFPGECADGGALRHFGYVEVRAEKDGLLGKKGTSFRGHEFHHWVSSSPGDAFTAVKPDGSRQWGGGFHTETLYAGFPHLFFPGCPEICRRFVEKCAWYHQLKGR